MKLPSLFLLLLLLLTACFPEGGDGRLWGKDIPIAEVQHLETQDTLLEDMIEKFEARWDKKFNSDHYPNIWWTDTPCPDGSGNLKVFFREHYFWGLTFDCGEMYVAFKGGAEDKTCGTALVHEVGHCLLMSSLLHKEAKEEDVFYGDRYHKFTEFWEWTKEIKKYQCENNL